MQFTFLNPAGGVLFLRDDAETAELTHEELTLNAEFPAVDGKKIETGQRVYFRSPSTNTPQVYEVRNAKTLNPDGVQQIVAEHICISELTDEHIDNKTHENKAVKNVLQSVLSGTLWAVGTVDVNPVSSVEISRGSVWQAVLQIRNNYNVYIEPRVTLSDNGTISRKLDVKSTDGAWHGLRLSIDKNLLDPSVTYDDTNLATALYGYGGTEVAKEQGQENKEINFSGVTWSKTADHPAKPAGQKYLEDPEATRLYGRNGRPRFGYYQNTEIMDANTLLQKTWETLKTCNTPDVSIDGTVEDLYRMGYADEPIRLHDIALVEVSPAGFKKQIQIIRFRENLLDPSGSAVTIGSYIPNIVFIEKKTNEEITGSPGGGGSGGGGNKSKQTERQEFETKITANNQMIQLRAYQNDLNNLDSDFKKQDAKLTVLADRITAEVKNRQEADKTLSGKITVQANKISLVVKEDHGVYTVDSASIVAGINAQSGSYVKISAKTIDLSGYVMAKNLSSEIASLQTVNMKYVDAVRIDAEDYTGSEAAIDKISCDSFYIEGDGAEWLTVSVPSIGISAYKNFQSVSGTTLGALITSYTTNTIHYLGHT